MIARATYPATRPIMTRCKGYCPVPTPEGPCGKLICYGGSPRCKAHGGGRRCRNLNCKKGAQSGTFFCCRHLHNTACQFPNCGVVVRRGGAFCGKHAKTCLFAGCTSRRQGGAGSLYPQYCLKHGGGSRCSSEACAGEDPPPYAGFKSPLGDRLCWFCFAALYPERARLKVRKEHKMVQLMQQQLPWLPNQAVELVWDCRVPGGCSLKRPDVLYRFGDRFLQLEIDEDGHVDRSCADEDSRLELIAADVGLPGLVLRLNPDAESCLKRHRRSSGESYYDVGNATAMSKLLDDAKLTIESFMSDSNPQGVLVAGLPLSWWNLRNQ